MGGLAPLGAQLFLMCPSILLRTGMKSWQKKHTPRSAFFGSDSGTARLCRKASVPPSIRDFQLIGNARYPMKA